MPIWTFYILICSFSTPITAQHLLPNQLKGSFHLLLVRFTGNIWFRFSSSLVANSELDSRATNAYFSWSGSILVSTCSLLWVEPTPSSGIFARHIMKCQRSPIIFFFNCLIQFHQLFDSALLLSMSSKFSALPLVSQLQTFKQLLFHIVDLVSPLSTQTHSLTHPHP